MAEMDECFAELFGKRVFSHTRVEREGEKRKWSPNPDLRSWHLPLNLLVEAALFLEERPCNILRPDGLVARTVSP